MAPDSFSDVHLELVLGDPFDVGQQAGLSSA